MPAAFLRLAVAVMGAGALACRVPAAGQALAPEQTLEMAALDLLTRRCVECHHGSEAAGGLNLTTAEGLQQGGDSGPAVSPDAPAGGLLWARVFADEMPPERPLTAADKAALKGWLEHGAPWGAQRLDPFQFTTSTRAGYDWWSLQPLRETAPPLDYQSPAGMPATAPDAFIIQQLRARELPSSPEADRRVLIRRLSFDLLGLPPSPEQVQVFQDDEAPDACERLVDRLLASPAYGERWGRHWLDIIRFGESQGFERDKLRENAWRYRDWVIASWNADRPYDEFVRQQLAGDVLFPDDPEALIATGFLVAGPFDEVGQKQQSTVMRAVVRQDELEDITGTVAQTFLGLTVHCARCHDHKFDPISQSEYYQLVAALDGVRHGERELPMDVSTDTLEQLTAPLAARLARVERQLSAWNQEEGARGTGGSEDRRVEPSPADRSASRSAPGEHVKDLQFERAQLLAQLERCRDRRIYAVVPGKPGPNFVLRRGSPLQRGEAVLPGGLKAIAGLSADFELPADSSDEARRRRLAEWLTDPRNPLLSRVLVNRLWHYHFGRGIVETTSDFGFNGARPTHPELLDWLARELQRHQLRSKPVQRAIVLSAAFRQASQPHPAAQQIDADNRWLWRKEPIRLEAEVLRDAMLSVSGMLNPLIGGPGYQDFRTYVHNTQFYELLDPVGESFRRRSVYRTWVRSGRNPLLDVFDCPDPSTRTPQRAVTTTPLQALSLLNNSLVLRLARQGGEEAEARAGPSSDRQVRWLFARAFQRNPDPQELQVARTLVESQGAGLLCRVIFNSNEFLYVD